MDGLTILEITRATEEIINKPLTITWCVVALIAFIFSIIISFYFGNGFIGMLGLFYLICALDIIVNPITEKEELGYNKIIAHVDTNIITEDKLKKEGYMILDNNEDIYILRKIFLSEDVQSETQQ